MLKLVGMLVLFLVAFASTLVGLLAATGNLSQESLEAMLGKAQSSKGGVTGAEDVDSLTMQLKAERQRVREREEELDRREKRLKMLQRDIEERRTELSSLLDEVKQGVSADEQNQDERLQDVVETVEGMESEKAAEVLGEWPVDEAAQILGLLNEKARGSILDAMDTDQVILILRALREGQK
jgi:flagellar motility protein MotE (MotC chaperone)